MRYCDLSRATSRHYFGKLLALGKEGMLQPLDCSRWRMALAATWTSVDLLLTKNAEVRKREREKIRDWNKTRQIPTRIISATDNRYTTRDGNSGSGSASVSVSGSGSGNGNGNGSGVKLYLPDFPLIHLYLSIPALILIFQPPSTPPRYYTVHAISTRSYRSYRS